jgi:hypothetical protein
MSTMGWNTTDTPPAVMAREIVRTAEGRGTVEAYQPRVRSDRGCRVRTRLDLVVLRTARCFALGLCGQAPSDDPEFARFLVDEGIDSISLNPDAVLRAIEVVADAERGGR